MKIYGSCRSSGVCPYLFEIPTAWSRHITVNEVVPIKEASCDSLSGRITCVTQRTHGNVGSVNTLHVQRDDNDLTTKQCSQHPLVLSARLEQEGMENDRSCQVRDVAVSHVSVCKKHFLLDNSHNHGQRKEPTQTGSTAGAFFLLTCRADSAPLCGQRGEHCNEKHAFHDDKC